MADLTFLHGSHTPRCVSVVDKRFPDYCSFQVMTRGAIDLSYDRESYTLQGRWVFLSYPGPWTHFERAAGQAFWTHRYVAFRGPLMHRWEELGLLPFRPQRIPPGDYVERFDVLLRLFPRSDQLGHLRAVNLLENLLLELADQRRPEKVQWLDRAKDLVLRVSGQPDYERIATELGMALTTFRRAFREEAGIAVHQFLLRSRVDSARHLLEETQLPIKAIARQLGYRDVFFFSRQFAKLTGSSPGAYRERLRLR